MAKREDFVSLGSTGLNRFGGEVYEEYNPNLRSNRIATRVFWDMANNCSTVGAILYVIESLFRQVDWRVEPASEDSEAIAQADFVEECMSDMSHTWDDLISEVLTMLVQGWSYFEIVYKLRKGRSEDPSRSSKFDDGKVGWRKIPIRAQDTLDRWDFDDDGGIRGLWQQSPPHYVRVFLPIEKCLLFRVRSNKNNPQGRTGGILRNAYRSWFFAKRIQEIEAVGIERDLVGYPVIRAPLEVLASNASGPEASTRSMLENLVQRIRRDDQEGCLFPPKLDREGNPTGYDIELLNSGGTRNFNTGEVIQRYETRIAQSVLADFVMLGHDGVGSFALSDNKTKMFSLSLGAIRDSITSVFDRFLIPRLMAANGVMDESIYPTIKAGDFDTPALADVAQYVSQLASVGAMDVGPKLQRRLLEIGRLPEEEEPDDAGIAHVDVDDVDSPIDIPMTGIQIQSAQQIVEAVSLRKIPRESGIAIIMRMYVLPRAEAEEIMGEAGRTFFSVPAVDEDAGT